MLWVGSGRVRIGSVLVYVFFPALILKKKILFSLFTCFVIVEPFFPVAFLYILKSRCSLNSKPLHQIIYSGDNHHANLPRAAKLP